MQSTPLFRFFLYRFIGPFGNRTTELVRDPSQADGMRTLVEQDHNLITDCCQRVTGWAALKGISVRPKEPFPSAKYPGKVWLEFRFGGLTL